MIQTLLSVTLLRNRQRVQLLCAVQFDAFFFTCSTVSGHLNDKSSDRIVSTSLLK